MRYSLRLQAVVVGFAAAVACGAAWAASRTWTDAKGKYTIEAELVEATAEHVVLKKSDGNTVTVPLAKLSADDQKFAAEKLAARSASSKTEASDEATAKKTSVTGDAAADRVAARKVASEFFDKLLEEDRTVVGDLLTAAAKERLTAGSSPVSTLPKPDSARTVRVGKATVNDDEATVTAKLRVGGANQDVKVLLRREKDAWKIRAVAAAVPGGDEQTVDFEEGSASGIIGEGPIEPGAPAPQAKELIPPEGDAQALIEFMDRVQKDPRFTQDREYVKQALLATANAADKVFELEGTAKTQLSAAANRKLLALMSLVGQDVNDLNERIEQLAKQVERHEIVDLVRPVEALSLRLELHASQTPAAVGTALKKVKAFLAGGPVDGMSASLASFAAQAAEQMQYRGMKPADVADAIENLAGPLAASNHAQVAALGNQLMSKARRLGLVGKSMELRGLIWDGKPLDMSQFAGKVVLVDFWATWCGPCIAEMPNIRANYDKYHQQGFDVIAISIDSDLNALNEYVQREQVPWTVVADRHKDVSPSDRLADYYGVNAIPCTILIGRNGNVVALNVRGEQLGRQLERLMGGGK